MALVLTRLSTLLGTCEHILESFGLPNEAKNRFKSSMTLANTEIERAGRRIRDELRKNRQRNALKHASVSAETLLRDTICLFQQRLTNSNIDCQFDNIAHIRVTFDQGDFCYLFAGLFHALLRVIEVGTDRQQRIEIGAFIENSQLCIELRLSYSNRTFWNQPEDALRQIANGGFNNYIKLLAQLCGSLGVCSHQGNPKAYLQFRLPYQDSVN